MALSSKLDRRRCGRLRGALVVLFMLWTAAASAAEQARSADAFVDSIGINTHYGNAIYVGGNAYANPAIDEKLGALGIRHLRDHTWNETGLARIDGLYNSYGVRTNLILGETDRSPAQLAELFADHPAYEAVEGLNEPDFNTRSYNGLTDNTAANRYLATRAFQNDLYAAVKANPETADVDVFSPAMGSAARSQYLVGTGFDYASMHSYPNGRNPTHLLDTKITQTNQMNGAGPNRPIVATETGYYNRPADGGNVSETAMGKYLPRLFAEYFNRGIARTYSYELADQGPSASEREQNFGLLRFDLSEKPAYTVMKNLIELIEEPAFESFSPGALDYTLEFSPRGATLHHTLLEKSDGTYYLLLWNEVASWNLTSQTDIANANVPVTVRLHERFDEARVYRPGSSSDPIATYANPESLNLLVPDEILVLELRQIVPEPSAYSFLVFGAMASLIARRRGRAHRNGVGCAL